MLGTASMVPPASLGIDASVAPVANGNWNPLPSTAGTEGDSLATAGDALVESGSSQSESGAVP